MIAAASAPEASRLAATRDAGELRERDERRRWQDRQPHQPADEAQAGVGLLRDPALEHPVGELAPARRRTSGRRRTRRRSQNANVPIARSTSALFEVQLATMRTSAAAWRGSLDPGAVLLDAMGTLLTFEPPAPHLRAALLARAGVDRRRGGGGARDPGRDRLLPRAPAQGRRRRRAGRAAARERGGDAAGAAGARAPRRRRAHRGAAGRAALPRVPGGAGRAAGAARAGLRLVVVSNWDVSLHERLAETGLRRCSTARWPRRRRAPPSPTRRSSSAALALAGVRRARRARRRLAGRGRRGRAGRGAARRCCWRAMARRHLIARPAAVLPFLLVTSVPPPPGPGPPAPLARPELPDGLRPSASRGTRPCATGALAAPAGVGAVRGDVRRGHRNPAGRRDLDDGLAGHRPRSEHRHDARRAADRAHRRPGRAARGRGRLHVAAMLKRVTPWMFGLRPVALGTALKWMLAAYAVYWTSTSCC